MDDANSLPREEFYSAYVGRVWPDDTAESMFLGRAVFALGKKMFPGVWSDADATATVDDPVHAIASDRDTAFAPTMGRLTNRMYADELLRAYRPDLPRPDRVDPGEMFDAIKNGAPIHDFPQLYFKAEEQRVAIELAQEHSLATFKALTRFTTVAQSLITAAANDQIQTFARPVVGGRLEPLDAGLWHSEQIFARFENCMIDLADPFSPTCPKRERAHFIFVERSGFNRYLEGVGAGTEQRNQPSTPRRFSQKDLREWAQTQAKAALPIRDAAKAAQQRWPDPAARPSRQELRQALRDAYEAMGAPVTQGRRATRE